MLGITNIIVFVYLSPQDPESKLASSSLKVAGKTPENSKSQLNTHSGYLWASIKMGCRGGVVDQQEVKDHMSRSFWTSHRDGMQGWGTVVGWLVEKYVAWNKAVF